jgi:MscS family membrane protein
MSQLPLELQNILVRILLAILAFALVWMLLRLLAWVIVRPLRAIARNSTAQWDDLLLDTLRLPVRFLVVAFGLTITVRLLEVDPGTAFFIDRLIRTLIILAVFVGLFKAVDIFGLSNRRLREVSGLNIEDALLPFVRTALQLIVIASAMIVVIQEWGYDAAGIITGLGLGGLAFSLAAQDTISNLFGFGMIVSDRPFVVGEYIKSPDVEGIVEKVGLRSTRVRQQDQALVSVPNNKLAASAVLNWSRLSKRWVNFKLRITYDASSEELRTLVERIRSLLAQHPEVEQKSIQVVFLGFGDIALEILVRCYLFKPDWYEFQIEQQGIFLQVMDIVNEMGLTLALPSQTMYLERREHPEPNINIRPQPTVNPAERIWSASAPSKDAEDKD